MREDEPGDKPPGRLRGARRRPWRSRLKTCAPRSAETLPETWCRRRSWSSGLPLTPNGKVDRRALAGGTVPAVRPDGRGSWRRGRRSRRCWPRSGPRCSARAARIGRIGAHDNFFALGGHSLLATQVMSRVRDAFGVELPLRALFEAPTVAALAARIDGERARGARAASAASCRCPGTATCRSRSPSSASGSSTSSAPDSPVYNMPVAVRLTGALDAGRPCAEPSARSSAATRRCAPRSSPASDGPVQVIAPAAGPRASRWSIWRGCAEERRGGSWRGSRRDEARRPFDLAAGPLVRAALLRLAAREHTLLVNLHHIVSDGWSMGILFRELATLYGAFCQGAPSPLPELPIQYADFAVWQREWLSGERLAAELDYWRRQLAGHPGGLELPPTSRGRRSNLPRRDRVLRAAGRAGARARRARPPPTARRCS